MRICQKNKVLIKFMTAHALFGGNLSSSFRLRDSLPFLLVNYDKWVEQWASFFTQFICETIRRAVKSVFAEFILFGIIVKISFLDVEEYKW
jgi:hypothetical protein